MSKGVNSKMRTAYRRLVIDKPWLVLALVAALTAWAISVIPKTTLDASADSLLLQGDPSLADFRDVSARYGAAEFLLLTWQPEGELLSDESLVPLGAMADELRALPGVLSVVTALDVPLVESPRKSLSDVLGDKPLPTLSDPTTDRALAIEELKSSVIYSELLASKDGTLSAVQVNLEPFTDYDQALKIREDLRAVQVERSLTEAELAQLEEAELAVKVASAQAMAQRTELVASVRLIAEPYRQHADIFVGGVPMIASDMVAFVRSDLVVFGAAIVGVMMLVLAVVFGRARWVAIPVVTCIVTVAVVLGILAAIDWRMTVISSNFVAVLLIISLSIAIHLVVRYREIHQQNPEMPDADRIEAAMAAMAVPCLYTGLTTIVAFLSLLVSRIQPVIDFGSMMTLGIVLALIFAFTVVPAMMRVWPAGNPMIHTADQKPFTRHFARWVDQRGGLIITATGALVLTVVVGVSQLKVENRFIDYFKDTTEIYQGMELLDAELGGTIGFDITLAAPTEVDLFGDLGLASVDAETNLDDFAADDPFLEEDPFAASSDDDLFASDGDIFAEDDPFADDDLFGDTENADSAQDAGFTPSYWFSLQGRQEIAAVQNYLQGRDEVGKVMSLDTLFSTVEVLFNGPIGSVELALVQRSMPADIADLLQTPYFDAERNEARVSLRVKETSKTLRRDAFLRQVKDDLINELGIEEERITMSGMLVLYNNVLQSLFASQIMTLGAVFGVILVMFYLLFRSLSLALLALAPNLLAAGLVLGIMGLANIPLDIMTITIAAIVVGMGVDNCIHYVHRFKREFAIDQSYTAAMHRCHLSIGRAMYYTTLTVVIGFSMLILSNFKPSTYFGALTAVAMIAAVLGALLLLPRLIVLLKPLGPEANHAVS
jgi:predicted RND superfamily exporter protein